MSKSVTFEFGFGDSFATLENCNFFLRTLKIYLSGLMRLYKATISAAIGGWGVPPVRGGSLQASLPTIWNNALPCRPNAERGTGRDSRDKQELAPPYSINQTLY